MKYSCTHFITSNFNVAAFQFEKNFWQKNWLSLLPTRWETLFGSPCSARWWGVLIWFRTWLDLHRMSVGSILPDIFDQLSGINDDGATIVNTTLNTFFFRTYSTNPKLLSSYESRITPETTITMLVKLLKKKETTAFQICCQPNKLMERETMRNMDTILNLLTALELNPSRPLIFFVFTSLLY